MTFISDEFFRRFEDSEMLALSKPDDVVPTVVDASLFLNDSSVAFLVILTSELLVLFYPYEVRILTMHWLRSE